MQNENEESKKRKKMTNDLGVLVVHLQFEYLYHVSRRFELGYNIVQNLVEYAAQHSLPVIFSVFQTKKIPELITKISKNLPKESYKLSFGGKFNSFQGDDLLVREFIAKGVKRIILSGFNKYCCVYRTAQGALDNGFNFCTSNDVLFSWDSREERDSSLENLRNFYKKKETLYTTCKDLLACELGACS